MKISIEESVDFTVPPDVVWGALVDHDNLNLFTGSGPIPGIVSARWTKGDGHALGNVREVRNADGSTHYEEVVTADPPRETEDRIFGFNSPFRFIVNEARDRFQLFPAGNGTTLRRTFSIDLKSPALWPAAKVIMFFMRHALKEHHRGLAKKLRSA